MQENNNGVAEIWRIHQFPERQEHTKMLEKEDNGHSHRSAISHDETPGEENSSCTDKNDKITSEYHIE